MARPCCRLGAFANAHQAVEVADHHGAVIGVERCRQQIAEDADRADAQPIAADADRAEKAASRRNDLGVRRRTGLAHALDACLRELAITARLRPAVAEARRDIVELVGPRVAERPGRHQTAHRRGHLRPQRQLFVVQVEREHRAFDLRSRAGREQLQLLERRRLDGLKTIRLDHLGELVAHVVAHCRVVGQQVACGSRCLESGHGSCSKRKSEVRLPEH